jgi:hypothetical protein
VGCAGLPQAVGLQQGTTERRVRSPEREGEGCQTQLTCRRRGYGQETGEERGTESRVMPIFPI